MASDDIVQLPPDELDGDEGWHRLTSEPLLRGVEAIRYPGADGWQVGLWVAEFVREEPLESRMRTGVASAIAGVAGVASVLEEDRETWFVQGEPEGPALVAAVAAVVDAMASEVRAAYPDVRWTVD